jgi:hypothetical protein
LEYAQLKRLPTEIKFFYSEYKLPWDDDPLLKHIQIRDKIEKYELLQNGKGFEGMQIFFLVRRDGSHCLTVQIIHLR